MKKLLLCLALCISSMSFAATYFYNGGTGVYIVAPAAPPAYKEEVVTTSPGPNYVWVRGTWGWHDKWVWQPGSWTVRPHDSAVWVDGRWESRPHGWLWIPGYWR